MHCAISSSARRQIDAASIAMAAVLLLFTGPTPARADAVAAVFGEMPAPYQTAAATVAGSATLRTLRVEERTGVARHQELVRVPLFFGVGECATPDAITVLPEGGGEPLVLQADDVRLGPDGGVSRMHVWFEIDLGAWERKTFLLVHRSAAAPRMAAMKMDERGDELHIAAGRGDVTIARRGPHAGALLGVRFPGGAALTAREGFAPGVSFNYSAVGAAAAPVELPGGAAPQKIEWAAGPLFAKVRVRWEDKSGAALEQIYRVDRGGRALGIEQTAWPGPGKGFELATRTLLAGAPVETGRTVVAVPAGLRREMRAVQPYVVSALVAEATGPGILSAPVTMGGAAGRITLERGRFVLGAPAKLSESNDATVGTLRAFWTETELIPSTSSTGDALWETYDAHAQPLVAVVDEPGLTAQDFADAVRALIGEMKPIGWRQEAGRLHVLGKTTERDRTLAKAPKAAEADPDYLRRGAENAWKKLSENGGRTLREDEKSRASGPIDPYNITYTESAAAALDALGLAPPTVQAIGRANATAAREFLGRTDENGFPYIDCFNRALNMQLGAIVFGLQAGRDDAKLGAFYRDLAGAPAVLAVYGRAQRPYSEKLAPSADSSDFLYQAVCDFWLRAAELVANEDLGLHPLAYARYTDCIDVLADRYHGVDLRDADGKAGDARANFWRAQPHTHRWLGWSCAPFMRLLENPGDTTGLTEAVQYCRLLRGRWKNWPDLTYYVLAAILPRGVLPRYQPPALLPRPAEVKITAREGGREVTWSAVPGAASYRVFRAHRDGGSWQWLNSPYRATPPAPKETTTRFVDPEGRASDRYAILAEDAAGRGSRWFSEGAPPPVR